MSKEHKNVSMTNLSAGQVAIADLNKGFLFWRTHENVIGPVQLQWSVFDHHSTWLELQSVHYYF